MTVTSPSVATRRRWWRRRVSMVISRLKRVEVPGLAQAADERAQGEHDEAPAARAVRDVEGQVAASSRARAPIWRPSIR